MSIRTEWEKATSNSDYYTEMTGLVLAGITGLLRAIFFISVFLGVSRICSTPFELFVSAGIGMILSSIKLHYVVPHLFNGNENTWPVQWISFLGSAALWLIAATMMIHAVAPNLDSSIISFGLGFVLGK